MREWWNGGCSADIVQPYSCQICRKKSFQKLEGMGAFRICPFCCQELGILICEGLDERPPTNFFDSPDDAREYRIRRNPSYIAQEVRDAVFERDGRECGHCGGVERPSLDHRLPVSRGGLATVDNLWVLCAPCNSSKRNKTVEEWLAKGGNRSLRLAQPEQAS